MDEDYIDIVRKSLYRRPVKSEPKSSHNMPRKEKKIKFAMDHYNSETVFKKEKSDRKDKIKQRKLTPFRKDANKGKAVTIQNNANSFEELDTGTHKNKTRKHSVKHTQPKKRKLVIAFSSDSSEEAKDELLSPSKSEMEYFNTSFNQSNEVTLIESSSDSEGSVNTFNLDNFFNTYEPSLNESITEAHAGIDNEFESEYVSNFKIMSSTRENEETNEEEIDEETGSGYVIVISDNETPVISDDNVERNIEDVANGIQKTIVHDDRESLRDSPVAVNDNQQNLEYLGEYSTVDSYNLQDCMIVILKENQFISVYGYLRVEILYGKIDIYGSVLDKTSPGINLYSPRGSALLQFVNLTNEDTEDTGINVALSELPLDGVSATNKCSIVKCTKLEDTRISFIEKYISQQIFPKLDKTSPHVIFQPTGNWNVIKENYAWIETLNNVNPSTKLLLAGGKGVGKSTLLRYGINRLLNTFGKIRVIDLDPGQSEFAVPGCVSIVTVTEPVFGPNYTHLKSTDRSLLSNINVGQDPRAYIKCVESLMNYYNTLEKCPTLINYMGFVQGIGLNLISSVITYVQPTDIIQIQSKHSRKNFINYLTRDVVQANCSLFTSNAETLDYWHLHKIQAMNDDNEGWSLEPRQSREMCVLAYLGQMMSGNVNSLLSHNLPMYETKLSSLKLVNLDRQELPPAAVNANLVALCTEEETTNIFICLGYGVVRGIDLETDTLVLLTPEEPTTLEKVSHLIMGNVSLPPSVYMTPDGIQGSIPYVMQGELISLGQITKRTYLPINKKT